MTQSPKAVQTALAPNPAPGSRMNGRELHGENASPPHNLGSNKTSCGACGSTGEELSQDERWHTDETKIADTDETKIADT